LTKAKSTNLSIFVTHVHLFRHPGAAVLAPCFPLLCRMEIPNQTTKTARFSDFSTKVTLHTQEGLQAISRFIAVFCVFFSSICNGFSKA